MRAQYTLKDTTVEALKRRAAALGIHTSRLVEAYVTAGLRSMPGLNLLPDDPASPTGVASESASAKPDPAAGVRPSLQMSEIFEDEPR